MFDSEVQVLCYVFNFLLFKQGCLVLKNERFSDDHFSTRLAQWRLFWLQTWRRSYRSMTQTQGEKSSATQLKYYMPHQG